VPTRHLPIHQTDLARGALPDERAGRVAAVQTERLARVRSLDDDEKELCDGRGREPGLRAESRRRTGVVVGVHTDKASMRREELSLPFRTEAPQTVRQETPTEALRAASA